MAILVHLLHFCVRYYFMTVMTKCSGDDICLTHDMAYGSFCVKSTNGQKEFSQKLVAWFTPHGPKY